MALVRCPHCGRSEHTDLHGRYLVECSDCGQKFAAVILSSGEHLDLKIVCPQCSHSEIISIHDDAVLKVKCSQCGCEFGV